MFKQMMTKKDMYEMTEEAYHEVTLEQRKQ